MFVQGATRCALEDEVAVTLQRFVRSRFAARRGIAEDQIEAVLSALVVQPAGNTSDDAAWVRSRCPHTLPVYYLRHMAVGPRVLPIEPCRYYISGCWRGCDCKYSHLTGETEEAIRQEFERNPIDRTVVRAADILVRRARSEGLAAPDILAKYPNSFPA